MFDQALVQDAHALVDAFIAAGLTIATAESCTGGLVAGLLTEVPHSSRVFDRGFVTYSIAAKSDMLGVPSALIERLGAVSPEVAIAMAEGALRQSRAQVSIAVTGIAGPDGGTADKPVGLVYLAAARRGRATLHRECRFGSIGRTNVRMASVREALTLLRAAGLGSG